MSHKVTHEEFLSRLPKKIKDNFIIKNCYTTSLNRIILEDKLGILYSSKPYDLLSGRYPSIINAINQTDAISKIVKDMFSDLEVCSEYIGHESKILVKDSLGIVYNTTPRELKAGKRPLLYSAVNPTEAFIIKANLVHNNKYNYSKSKYLYGNKKVTIICLNHGNFTQTAVVHLSGQGCPKCGRIEAKNKTTKEESIFIEECKNIYKDKYDYSEVNYKTTKDKIKVICKIHGAFYPIANNHLRGSECPKCSRDNMFHLGYNKTNWINKFLTATGNKMPIVYIIELFDKDTEERFIKIGRSFRSVVKRLGKKPNKSLPYSYKILSIIEGEIGFIYDLEKKLHRDFKKYKYIPFKEFSGYNECFTLDILKDLKYEKI